MSKIKKFYIDDIVTVDDIPGIVKEVTKNGKYKVLLANGMFLTKVGSSSMKLVNHPINNGK